MAETWVVVAESARAKIFALEGNQLRELTDMVHPEARVHEQKLTSDLPGRTHDSAGQGRHAMEEDTRPKVYEAESFAREIGQHLELARGRNEFGKLMLVASPKFLGMLRTHLPPETMKFVTFELDKDLVKEDAKTIRGHLPA